MYLSTPGHRRANDPARDFNLISRSKPQRSGPACVHPGTDPSGATKPFGAVGSLPSRAETFSIQYLDHPVLGFLQISDEVNRVWSKSRCLLVEGRLSKDSVNGFVDWSQRFQRSTRGFSRPRRGLLASVKAFSTPGHHMHERHLREGRVHETYWMPGCRLERECSPPQPASPLALAEHCAERLDRSGP
jgi:hypothetical protein